MDADYTAVDTMAMLQGTTMQMLNIMVPITDDNIVEDTETLTVVFTVMGDSGNIDVFEPSTATITILDIDGRGTLH